MLQQNIVDKSIGYSKRFATGAEYLEYLHVPQELNRFKEFQSSIENKQLKTEEAIISNSTQKVKPTEIGDLR